MRDTLAGVPLFVVGIKGLEYTPLNVCYDLYGEFKETIMKVRKKTLFGLLALVVAFSAYSLFETWQFRRQLATDAERLVAEMKEDITLDEKGSPSHDVISVVVASREYGYWGKPVGKITVFLRNNQMDSDASEELPNEEDFHAHGGAYSGIDYFYDKSTTGWINTESALCSSGDCQVLGKQAFVKAGV